MRALFTQDFAIKRLTHTLGKSTWSVVGGGVGFFKAMADEMALINNVQVGQGHVLMVDLDTDIRNTDKIGIDDEDYTVKGISKHKMYGLTFYKILLTRGVAN
jgi:hypothetical protein